MVLWFLREKKHGLFTYYFLEGLHNGNADKNGGNGDKKITHKELYDYLKNQVKEYALRKDKEQVPEWHGANEDEVFVEIK